MQSRVAQQAKPANRYGSIDYSSITQTGTIGQYWNGLADPEDSMLFQTSRISTSEGGMAGNLNYKLPLSDGWCVCLAFLLVVFVHTSRVTRHLVYILFGERPYGGAEFTVTFEGGQLGAISLPRIRPRDLAGGLHTAVILAQVVNVTGGALEITTTTQVEKKRSACCC